MKKKLDLSTFERYLVCKVFICIIWFSLLGGAIGQAIRHHLDREIALGFGQGDLTQAFAERLGRIYGSDTFGVSESRPPESRVHRRAAKHGLSIKCEISYVEVPVKNDEDEMEIVGWPVLLPRDLMIALINSGYLHMLAGTVEQREAFWERALLDYPQETNNIDPKCCAPYSLYGDESTIFRTSCMILHWHPTLSPKNTNSLLSRFLLCIVPADKYWVVHWLCKVAVCSL